MQVAALQARWLQPSLNPEPCTLRGIGVIVMATDSPESLVARPRAITFPLHRGHEPRKEFSSANPWRAGSIVRMLRLARRLKALA